MVSERLRLAFLASLFASGVGSTHLRAELPTATFNGLSRANGKQVLRTGEAWLAITPEPSGDRAWLSFDSSKTPPTSLVDWKKTLFVSSDGQGLFRSRGPSAMPPSLVADDSGRIHAAWCDGESVWYASADAKQAQKLAERGAWTGADGQPPRPVLANAMFGDLAVDATGHVWISAVERNADGSTTLCLLDYAGKWNVTKLVSDVGFQSAVMDVSSDGTIHLAWTDTRGRLVYLRHRRGEPAEPLVLAKGGYHPNARNASIIAAGEQILVAYESLSDQIEYAVIENGKSSGIEFLSRLDARFASDVLHSPQLTLDRHGVVWLFFSDTTRRFTYFMRWLGHGWSDAYDCRGIYYRSPRFESDLLPADWLAVEKQPPSGATDIGIALANSLTPQENEFHAIQVPALHVSPGSTNLFLDLLETAELEKLDLVLDEAQRDPRNPLVKPGPPGSFDQDRVLNHGTVMFDDGKFRMWYGAAHRQRGVYWWRWMSSGYAESSDGLRWEKPCVEGRASSTSLDCNQLPLPWPCAVFKDADDPNPKGRYKCVQFDRHQLQLMAALDGKYDMDDAVVRGELLQSADGLHWTSEPISISFPDGKPRELVVQSFFIDRSEPDPAKRWKIYGYASLVTRRRAGCFAYSADGSKWTSYERNPILDPTVSEVPMVSAGPESQIHDTEVFRYGGYYLALFHAQHDGRFLDVELAASRDGEHFVHVKRGHKVLPLGAPGSWDSQQILQTVPVAAHDKLWLYYGGQAMPPELAAKGETNNELLVGGAGLATLRLDGFTHLVLRDGQANGSLTTIPLEIAEDGPLSLVVNAACAPEAKMQVEVLDAKTGKPIDGFGREDCQSLATDNLRHIIEWKRGSRLPTSAGCQVALRFWLESKGAAAGPRFYAFSFAQP